MVAASKNDTGQEYGEIQHLGSPILSKIQQAFMYIRTIATGKTREQFTSFRSVEGTKMPVAISFTALLCFLEDLLCFLEEDVLHCICSISYAGARNLSLHLGWNKPEARLIVSVKVSWSCGVSCFAHALWPCAGHVLTSHHLLCNSHLVEKFPRRCCKLLTSNSRLNKLFNKLLTITCSGMVLTVQTVPG